MREHTIRTAKGTVFFWSSAEWRPDRETLVFLHGLTGDHTMFRQQVDFFDGRYNLLLWDAPAHGKSRPFSELRYGDAAELLKRALDEHGTASAIFVGQSVGGYFVQSLIKRYPERVKGFVSIDSTPFGTAYYSRSDIWLLRQIEWMARLYPLGLLKRAIAKQVSVRPETYEDMLRMLGPYGKKELCRLMGWGYAGFLEDNCDLTITCPVLLLGERDNMGKVAAYARAWTEKTGFPLVVIEKAGHNSNVDNPERVNREIEAFAAAIRAVPGTTQAAEG